MNGFLNILKPPGMTSAAVVGFVRRVTGGEKVGHAGTLDPEASGVLPVMVGRAARLFDYLVDKEKEYVAEAAFGFATDSQDATGRVVKTGEAYPTLEDIAAALPALTGDIWQRPSVFSAIKQNGRPMYELAHRGETAEVPLRQVHVEEIRLMGETPRHGCLLDVRCGRGTYIRSICNDLGEMVGCPAHMRFLLRARSGVFDVQDALTLEEVTEAAAQGRLSALMLPLDAPLGHMPRADVPDALQKLVRCGSKLPVDQVKLDRALAEGACTRVYLGGAFYGIAARSGELLCWRAQIPPET